MGAAGASLALIVSSPFSSTTAPSFNMPSISLPASSGKPKATTQTSPPSAVKKVEKKAVKKAKDPSGYDFSLEQEVKEAEKEVKKTKAEEKKIAAEEKKAEQEAAKAAKAEADAVAAEKKVSDS